MLTLLFFHLQAVRNASSKADVLDVRLLYICIAGDEGLRINTVKGVAGGREQHKQRKIATRHMRTPALSKRLFENVDSLLFEESQGAIQAYLDRTNCQVSKINL